MTSVARPRGGTTQGPMQVVTVDGGPGGVGKTGICTKLAAALALLGRGIMLIDADLALASLDMMFCLYRNRTRADKPLRSDMVKELQ